MTKPVEASDFLAPIFPEDNSWKSGDPPSTWSTLKTIGQNPLEWIRSRVTLTSQELEMFEKLMEGAIRGGAAFFYDLSLGEEKLRQIDKACDTFYKILNEKWFPNVEGLLFLRQNLLKAQIRICAAIGQLTKVNEVKNLLEAIGGKAPADIELQIKVLSITSKPVVRFFLRIVNFFVKISMRFSAAFLTRDALL